MAHLRCSGTAGCWGGSPPPNNVRALHRAIASGSLDDPDAEFNFGMARILDGIATLIATKAQR